MEKVKSHHLLKDEASLLGPRVKLNCGYKNKIFLDFFGTYECFSCSYVCVLHACLGPTEIKKGLDPLRLELQWL